MSILVVLSHVQGVGISIYMCYSQADGFNTSLSRLSYLIMYTLLQLSGRTLSLYGTKYPMYWALMMNVT